MKYIKLVLEYLFAFERGKRFVLTALVVLPVAVLAGFFLPLDEYFGWILNFSGQYGSYVNLLQANFAGFNILIYFGIIVLALLTMAAVVSMMNYCLRTGMLRIGNIFRNINDNFFPALYVILLFGALAIFGEFLMTIFYYLVGLAHIPVLITVLSIFITLLFVFFIVLIAAALILMLPISSYYGVGPFRALGFSMQKTAPKFWSLVFAISVPMLLSIAAGFAVAGIGIRVVSIIVSTIVYNFMTTYLLSLSILAFYDIDGLTRDDTPRDYLYRKYK